MLISDFAEVRNARVAAIKIGSRYHDGRGFFTILLDGSSWGQGIQNLPLENDVIDSIILIAGAEDLFGSIGRLVRVCWRTPVRGCGPAIAAIGHIMDDTLVVVVDGKSSDA